METVLQLLDELEELLNQSRAVPFSNKVTVDKEELYDIIQEVRLRLPNEIKQSKFVIEERNKILIDAQKEADEILSDTKLRASRMVEDHEVTKMAYEQASEIIENAKKTSREMRLGTVEYTDQMLSITEDRLKEMLMDIQRENEKTVGFFKETLKKLQDDRQELQGAKR